MAQASGMSPSAISRVWRAFGLEPHLAEAVKFSTDSYCVEKVRDDVGLDLAPPEKAVVFSAEERSQVQALDRTQLFLPMTPGQAERGTHDYARYGTTSLLAASDVATGPVIGGRYTRHRHREFMKSLDRLDATLTKGRGVSVHIVLDNDATHKTPAVKRWLLRHPEYRLHFTPQAVRGPTRSSASPPRLRRGAFGVRRAGPGRGDRRVHRDAQRRPETVDLSRRCRADPKP